MGWTALSGFNQQFFISIIIIGLGYIFKRTGLLKETDGPTISNIIFKLTLPALIIVSFHDIELEPSLMILFLAGLGFGLILVAAGFIFLKNENHSIKGMLLMMLPGMNVGLFAFPLVEGIWGAEGIKYFALLDSGNAIIIFGLTYLIGSFYATKDQSRPVLTAAKKLTNSVPLMVYILTIIINLLNVQLPEIIFETASVISLANMPLSLLLLGLYLNFSFERRHLNLLSKYLGIRYGVSLLLGLVIYLFLPVSEMIQATLLIGLVLPVPFVLIPYAEEFKYDKSFIVLVTNVTMLISFFLIWLLVNGLF